MAISVSVYGALGWDRMVQGHIKTGLIFGVVHNDVINWYAWYETGKPRNVQAEFDKAGPQGGSQSIWGLEAPNYVQVLPLMASSPFDIAPSIQLQPYPYRMARKGAPATLHMTKVDGKYQYVQCELRHLVALNHKPQHMKFVLRIYLVRGYPYPSRLVDYHTRGKVSYLDSDMFQYPKTLEAPLVGTDIRSAVAWNQLLWAPLTVT